MSRTRKIFIMTLLLIFADIGTASIVDISVVTDKPKYQLGEYVTVSVIAFNPNPQPVVLNGGFYFASYLMDGIYDWAEGRSAPQVMQQISIAPYDSVTWDISHGFYEMEDYPLSAGIHTVVGEVLAAELYGNNESAPVQFEVIPEPATLAIFGAVLPFLRIFLKSNC